MSPASSSLLGTLSAAELFRAAGCLRREARRQRKYLSKRDNVPPDTEFLVAQKAATFDRVSLALCALGDERKGGDSDGE